MDRDLGGKNVLISCHFFCFAAKEHKELTGEIIVFYVKKAQINLFPACQRLPGGCTMAASALEAGAGRPGRNCMAQGRR